MPETIITWSALRTGRSAKRNGCAPIAVQMAVVDLSAFVRRDAALRDHAKFESSRPLPDSEAALSELTTDRAASVECILAN